MKKNYIRNIEVSLVLIGIISIVLGINVSISMNEKIKAGKNVTTKEEKNSEIEKIQEEQENSELQKDIKLQATMIDKGPKETDIVYNLENTVQKIHKIKTLTVTVYGKNEKVIDVLTKKVTEEIAPNSKNEYKFTVKCNVSDITNLELEYNVK